MTQEEKDEDEAVLAATTETLFVNWGSLEALTLGNLTDIGQQVVELLKRVEATERQHVMLLAR
jgi:hypothetical protein